MNRFNASSIRTAFTALAVESREREPHRAVGVGVTELTDEEAHAADVEAVVGVVAGAAARHRVLIVAQALHVLEEIPGWALPPPRLRAAAIADRPRRALLPSSILRGRRRGSERYESYNSHFLLGRDLTSVVAVLRRREAPESRP